MIYRNVSVKRATSNCLLVSVPCTCIASMAGVVNESSGICSAEEGSPLSTRNCMMGRQPWRAVLWARLKWCSLLPYVSTSWLLNMWCYVGDRTISSPTKHEKIMKSSSSLRGQASSLALIPAVGKQESQLKWINHYMYRYSVGRPSYLCTKQSN